jgi:signal transduction histidine kinase
MFGLFIAIVIAIAIIQRQRYRGLQDRMCGRKSDTDSGGGHGDHTDFATHVARKLDRKFQRMERRLRHKARGYDRYARYADKAERFAAKFERKAGVVPASHASAAPAQQQEPTFKSDDEREAYRRARSQASREAFFYVHLMWYGIVIGFLFVLNLVTSFSYPWFLWPAFGWGFGLVSHYAAVFGWDWIRQRVFEPAVAREVQREVLHEKEALHSEKQNSLDELTATFAHEIRNPIAAAKSLVQQMGEDPTSGENVEYAKVALDELARVERSVSHLLKYAKEEDYHFDSVNLAAVIDSSLTQMRNKLETSGVAISRNYLGGPVIRGDADKLRQVFSNIVDNAIDAMAANSAERRVEVSIQKRNGFGVVCIRDNGCGIDEDKLSKIFNPFFTSKENGTGLGMAVARKIIEAHRGTVEVRSQRGAGTEFEIILPVGDPIDSALGSFKDYADGSQTVTAQGQSDANAQASVSDCERSIRPVADQSAPLANSSTSLDDGAKWPKSAQVVTKQPAPDSSRTRPNVSSGSSATSPKVSTDTSANSSINGTPSLNASKP